VIQTIASVIPRLRTTLRGEIVSVNGFETPWVRTDAVLSDGTGTLVLRFVGRISVPGLNTGRSIVVDGTPGLVGGELVMLNPRYSFDGVR
jgi:hypothetical protein